eukprot:scaffold56577_cov37-Tisochrysis_lutea.AAC.1
MQADHVHACQVHPHEMRQSRMCSGSTHPTAAKRRATRQMNERQFGSSLPRNIHSAIEMANGVDARKTMKDTPHGAFNGVDTHVGELERFHVCIDACDECSGDWQKSAQLAPLERVDFDGSTDTKRLHDEPGSEELDEQDEGGSWKIVYRQLVDHQHER